MKRSHLVIAGLLACALLAISVYASPHWTVQRMKTAMADNDAARFSSYIDFPALRESMKTQMVSVMQARMATPEMQNNPLAGLGQRMGTALINPMIDAVVTPAGVMAMFELGQAAPVATRADDRAPKSKPSYDLRYLDWNTVVIANASGEDGGFVLKRSGLWSWQLAGLALPPTALDMEK